MKSKKHLKQLAEDWSDCDSCDLHEIRVNPVMMGSGNPDADIMFISASPTEHDVDDQVFYSGEQGDMLMTLLEQVEIPVSRTYRTSLIGCRSYVVIPATEESPEHQQDKLPPKECVSACSSRLDELIYTIDPVLIIALGDLAWKALVKGRDKKTYTTAAGAQGELFETKVEGRINELRYPVMAMVEMNKLINNPSAAMHGPIGSSLVNLRNARRYVDWLEKNEV